jgi:hypothetical protein
MTDRTQQVQTPTSPDATTPSSLLSDAERRTVERLTARNDPRYGADAQSQALLERARRLSRALLMRSDHGRWRVSKTKGIAWLTVAVAAVAFWNYLPRPNLASSFDAPGLGIASSNAPTGIPSRSTKPLERPELIVTAPPKMPAPKLETTAQPASPTSQPPPIAPVSSVPAYEPYQSAPLEPTPQAPVLSIPSPSGEPSFGSSALTPSSAFSDAPLSAFGSEARPFSASPRVASAPTPLVQHSPVSSVVPTPLIETRTTAPLEGQRDTGSGDSSALSPMVSTPSAASELGQAGVLVDSTATTLDVNNAIVNLPANNSSQSGGVLFDASRTAPNASGGAGASLVTRPQPSSPYPPGARVAAKLTLGVIVVQGQDSPVVAQLEDGALGLGKATLNGSRVQISLLEIVRDGSSSVSNGAVVSNDGFLGLTAPLLEDSPDVVGKLWQAGLQGVSNYAQSVIQGATTTIANGATSVTGPQPNLGLSLLQGLAQTFLAPTGQASIKYARLEPNTPFQVLFLPSK